MNRLRNTNRISDKKYRIICTLLVLTYVISLLLFILYPYIQSVKTEYLGYITLLLISILSLVIFFPLIYFVVEVLKKIVGKL